MKKTFPLFQSHIDRAHQCWSELLKPGDRAIDATCGNGHDTLFLASMGVDVYSIDVQQQALDGARQRAQNDNLEQFITFIQGCHSKFPDAMGRGSVKLVVYNLGYLPGGDKRVTTQAETTMASLQRARELIAPGGMISITCYPGHEEGKREEDKLLGFLQALSPKEWSCCYHQWINRKESPSLFLIQKASA